MAKTPRPCEQTCGEERDAEEQIQGERRPDELRQVGSHRYDLRLHPQPQGDESREALAADLGEVLAGGDPQLGRHRLDEHRHQVGAEDHPQQEIAKLRPDRDVGG